VSRLPGNPGNRVGYRFTRQVAPPLATIRIEIDRHQATSRADIEMTESGRKQAAASGDAPLAVRLEQGPLETLQALKSKLAGVASRGIADLRELHELDQLASTALKELDEIVLALPADESEPNQSPDFWVRLGEVCGGFHSSSGLECRLVIPQGHTRPAPASAEILLRVIGELLTNVRKHACANSVEVSSAVRSDGAVVFTVKDDGIGLCAPERIRPLEDGTFGLWSVKQRLQEIGAFMELTNDTGLCARVILPPQPRTPS
jgi:signal transduction histidine kinase